MKKNVLYYLEKAKGSFLSGEHIARELGVSRMAVSKAVAELKRDGAVIESSTKCGYKLTKGPDRLHAESIWAGLGYDAEVFCYNSIGSTNEEAKRLAAEGYPHGTIVAAESQSAGRGRYGRQFFSPSESGLYMSVLLRPVAAREGIMYTVAAAVAARRVISEYAADANIKWVNDIYIGARKVCGILCEAVSDLESGQLSAVICGIGVNLTHPEGGFPADIKEKAGCVSDTPVDRGEFASKLASTLLDVLALDNAPLIREYSRHMMLTGRRIIYTKNSQKHSGTVRGVDSTGGLIVEEGAKTAILTSGEVQLESF